MNPCTLGWYLPILVKDVPGALQPSECGGAADGGVGGSGGGCGNGDELGKGKGRMNTRGEKSKGASMIGTGMTTTKNTKNTTTNNTEVAWTWGELDAKFRRDLPDEAYLGRLAYRGLIMRACPRVKMVDGVEVTEKERVKAGMLLEGIVGRRRGGGRARGKGEGGGNEREWTRGRGRVWGRCVADNRVDPYGHSDVTESGRVLVFVWVI